MSNYPPGVTGMEPQIAGYPEGVHRMDCSNMIDTKRLTVEPRGDRLEEIRKQGWQWHWRLSELGVDEVECPFSGDLDVQYADGEAVADCPLCGQEIRIDLDDRP